MRKLVIIWCLLPVLGISQAKIVLSTDRLFSKSDKIGEFEKAVAAHAQKFHTGDWKWNVFDIVSGPDAGGIMVVEGPLSWEQLDTRGNISPEHNADFQNNVAPLTTDKSSSSFAVYEEELSSVKLTDYTDKIAILHVFVKPGFGPAYRELVMRAKKVWVASGQSVAVYTSSSSGPPQFTLVFRYKTGWKERDRNFMKPMKERWEAAHGAGSYDTFLTDVQKTVESSWEEMLVRNKDLGSK